MLLIMAIASKRVIKAVSQAIKGVRMGKFFSLAAIKALVNKQAKLRTRGSRSQFEGTN